MEYQEQFSSVITDCRDKGARGGNKFSRRLARLMIFSAVFIGGETFSVGCFTRFSKFMMDADKQNS